MNTLQTGDFTRTLQKATDQMMRKAVLVAVGISVFACLSAATVRADQLDKKTVITFSQPFEIPGRVLPAGTYTFKLADSLSDRHIVQIFNADASKIIATLMAIPNLRLTPTDKTVISFRETPAGTPESIRAWFFPGNTVGQEFVYPKPRAVQLAKIANTVVPAVAVDLIDAETMKSAAIVAITPDAQEVPVATAIQTMPAAAAAGRSMPASTRQLPQTASVVPIIAMLAFVSLSAAFGLLLYSQRTKLAAVRIR